MTALKQDRVSAILVDMYVPPKRKDLFSGEALQTFLIPKGFSYGAILKGDAVELEKDLKNVQVANRVQETFLLEGEEVGRDEGVSSHVLPVLIPVCPILY